MRPSPSMPAQLAAAHPDQRWRMPDDGAALGAHTLRALALGVDWFESGSGGLDRVFHDLVLALPDAGIDVSGLVLGPPDASARSGGRVTPFGRPGARMPERLWRARSAIAAALRQERVDLVAAHFAMFACPALRQLRDRPFVFHFHGPWSAESAEEGANGVAVALKRRVEQAVYRRADRVIVLSRAFAGLVHEQYGVREDLIRIVPGSVDTARFNTATSRAEARERLGWPADRPILLSVRRLARRMGLDRLIEAMTAVVRAEPDVLLMIVGRGRMLPALQAQVESLSLGRNVRFLGFVPDAQLPLVYRAADLNVIPTAALEGFGLTAIEALASGTCSLVTPVGALPEVAGELSPALVFRSPDAADIAERLIEARRGTLALPGERACRDYAVARYGAAQAAAAAALVYRDAAR